MEERCRIELHVCPSCDGTAKRVMASVKGFCSRTSSSVRGGESELNMLSDEKKCWGIPRDVGAECCHQFTAKLSVCSKSCRNCGIQLSSHAHWYGSPA